MTNFGTVRNVLSAFVADPSGAGRNAGGNLFFVGPTLYSYGSHYVIAALATDRKVAFLNTRKVSATTSKHLNAVHDLLTRSGYSITFTENPVDARGA